MKTIALLLFIFLSQITLAQTDSITLSITLTGMETRYFGADFFDTFERTHPGVQIQFVSSGLNHDATTIEGRLDHFEAYAQSADILVVHTDTLAKEIIDAGYLLDVAPLIQSDSSGGFSDLAKSAFAYKNGIWALPLGLDALVIGYDAARFDSVGLSYPDETWTLADYANAAQVLSTENNPGFLTYHGDSLLQSFTRAGDSTEITSMAEMYQVFPGMELVINQWKAPEAWVTDQPLPDIPLQTLYLSAETHLQIAPFPNGQTKVSGFGLAISKGTAQPELAYELVKYIVSDSGAAAAFGGVVGATGSFADTHPLPYSDTLLAPYWTQLRAIADGDFDLAVQQVNETLLNNEALAQARSNTMLSVYHAVPTAVSASPLRFGLWGDMSVNFRANESLWYEVSEEFTAANPEITAVQIETQFPQNGFEASTDCFYLPMGVSGVPPERLSLNPLIAADPDFDPADFVLSALERASAEDQLWGYPLTITPYVVWYNAQKFGEAGVPLPTSDWTIADFERAVLLLRSHTPDAPVLLFRDYINQLDMLLLMVAYGALPIDYKTNPPTLHLTDPNNIDIMSMVLDRIKTGEFASAFTAVNFVEPSLNNVPMYIDRVSWDTLGQNAENPDKVYTPVAFPRGETYTPVAFSIGAAYISAQSAHPEACYRWFKTLAAHPELFSAMPARKSQINNPILVAAQGQQVTDFYLDYLSVSEIPNSQPVYQSEASTELAKLFRAYLFDGSIVLSDELVNMEANFQAFYACLDDDSTQLAAYLECRALLDR